MKFVTKEKSTAWKKGSSTGFVAVDAGLLCERIKNLPGSSLVEVKFDFDPIGTWYTDIKNLTIFKQ